MEFFKAGTCPFEKVVGLLQHVLPFLQLEEVFFQLLVTVIHVNHITFQINQLLLEFLKGLVGNMSSIEKIKHFKMVDLMVRNHFMLLVCASVQNGLVVFADLILQESWQRKKQMLCIFFCFTQFAFHFIKSTDVFCEHPLE